MRVQAACWACALSVIVGSLLTARGEKTAYEQAAADIQAGHPEAALAILDPLIQSRPEDVKALTLMGMALDAAGKSENAGSYFEQALHFRPAYPPALKGLAMNEMTLNQHAAAKTHFEQLLAASPGDPVAHAGLGEIAFARGDFVGAIEHLEQARSLYENPRLPLKYARASLGLKRPDKVSAGARERAGAGRRSDPF